MQHYCHLDLVYLMQNTYSKFHSEAITSYIVLLLQTTGVELVTKTVTIPEAHDQVVRPSFN